MRIAIVGTGYVADYYLRTLPRHPQLELVGVMDRDGPRAERFARHHRVSKVYRTYEELLADGRVECVVNLTNPGSHYALTKAALEAGKHVYSEKPLATEMAQAEELVAIAESRGLRLASAPCTVLGETAQTMWKALREERIGRVRLVYAELDDGPIHLMKPERWRSESGSPWPMKDEYEVGCTMQHAGYYITWLVAFFGPAVRVASFSTVLTPDKGVEVDRLTPDFSVACIEFQSGTVARLTHSIYAPYNHGMRLIGDRGMLSTNECWVYDAPVQLGRRDGLGLKAEKNPIKARLVGLGPETLPLLPGPGQTRGQRNLMDVSRGIAEMAEAVAQERPCRLSPRFALHVNEVTLAIQHPAEPGVPRTMKTTCDPIEPMPWAR
ncbi:Gfo/Idh/MocA family protein [Vitiosangium sp. GDMCC 1.1324]|uniref:Gfo/Idh/MocA family protein n=1 Tax=Vitiosangium sp. (strain GDMCC 1.1324) TaxID=2138576 RepID=UPI000D33B6AA|nr:Gfo/Idh/MocA family oxidoreductase [Vitiosangium sp. GDMCC 1.1324]PTL85177.1 gfo/Idh/MocA family oxidoreductase [Vitiosangium sp. GDMCC 1.1324]